MALALATSTTSIGASRISRTRDHDTRAVARLAYRPINACAGANTRIWYARNAPIVPSVSVPSMTRRPP